MIKSGNEVLHEAVKTELNAAKLYKLYAGLFEEDKDFRGKNGVGRNGACRKYQETPVDGLRLPDLTG